MRADLRGILTAGLLIAYATSTWAMTEKQAANNLMYLVAARNEGSFCERFGGKALEALMAWETRNKETFEKSTRTIEDYAVATKTVSKEEATNVSLLLLARLQARDDRELAAKRTKVTCSRYADSLALYESKLAR